MRISPEEIGSRPAIVFSKVDLPQPDGPTSTSKVLRYDELGIEYRALSAEAHTAQGLNPTLHICDELG